MIAERQRF